MSGSKPDDVLVRRAMVRHIRMSVRARLADIQDRVLNEIEVDALERFDAALINGQDYAAVAEAVRTAPFAVHAKLELE